ncbi:MAG: UDP-glucose--hexose-1-phosphate uridylyltransferase [Sarcina sp.]
MIDINIQIERLIKYALDKNLIEKEDIIFSKNKIISCLGIDSYKETKTADLSYKNIEDILDKILKWASTNKVIDDTVTQRELLDTNIMGSFLKRPSEVIKEFYTLYEKNPVKATDNYYKFSMDTNYIRKERVKKDLKWKVKTEFGNLDITINMSKPEKDPIEIEKALKMPQGEYPKCLLCKECEGYTGRTNYPSRSNHRIIPIELKNNKWFIQYSPYVYFNEHSIILKETHSPMSISKTTFEELLEFVNKFKHYFIGSNADLPIVGGSILTHEHYQAGRNIFALDNADEMESYNIDGFEDVSVTRIKWPLTVIRAKSKNKQSLINFADLVLKKWRNYSDESVDIIAKTSDKHNTITPICRFRDENFEFDLVLRNNRKTLEHPFGIFHPHEELHHIKKENIGLIEVMGLAILPARLNKEIKLMKDYLLLNEEDDCDIGLDLKAHENWLKEIKVNKEISKENIDTILKNEIGKVFLEVLKHCGVFKFDNKGIKSFKKFMNSLNSKE